MSQLAQLNVGRLKAPLDAPEIAEFTAALPRINAIAEGAPGFVWRLEDGAADDTTGLKLFGDQLIIINASVWTSVEALHNYVFNTRHSHFLRRRREWFTKLDEAYAVLWWVEDGHRPSLSEMVERLTDLRTNGPSPRAFTFRALHPAPETAPAQ